MSGGRSSQRRQARAMEEANRIARERLEWQQGQMQRYEDMYGGVERQTIDDALRGVAGDYAGVTGRAAADVQQQMGAQRDEQSRRMAAYGLDPTSGRYQSADRAVGLHMASTSALAQNQARAGEKARTDALSENRRAQALNLGGMRFQLASGGMDSAYGGMINTKQSEAAMHGQHAAQRQARSAGIGQLVGTIGGAIIGGPMGASIGASLGGAASGGTTGGFTAQPNSIGGGDSFMPAHLSMYSHQLT